MPSEKILQQKQVVVKEWTDKVKAAKAIVFADYRGLTVEQDTQLREALRKADVNYSVVKNSMLRFAVKENNLESIVPYLSGPTAIAISNSDPVAPAKILAEYAKKFEALELKAGVVEGNAIDVSGIKDLANLPSREVLVSKVLGGLNAPISGFVNVLNANLKGLVVALNAVAEQKANA